LRDTLVLILLVLCACGPGLWGSFHFDDYSLFSDSGVTSEHGAWEVWQLDRTRPLTYFSFWLDHRLHGRNPLGFLATNLALHTLVVILLSHMLRMLLPGQLSWWAAALFAVHPIQAEAVYYVFARAIVLATLFCLVSMFFWLKGRHWLAVLGFIPAVLAKEECVAFPLFIGLLHLSVSRNPRELRPIGAMLAISLAAGLRVIWVLDAQSIKGAGALAGVSTSDYLLTQSTVILRYLRLLVIPWGFTVDPEIAVAPAWLGVLCWAGLCAVAWFTRRKFEKARECFWWVAGITLLLPSSSIFPAIDLAADRRMYLPMIAFAPLAALAGNRIAERRRMAILGVLLLLMLHRAYVWHSDARLWSEAVDRAPGKVRPRIQLARASSPDLARTILEQAQKLAPDDPRPASEIGRLLLERSDAAGALAYFGHALALSPSDPRLRNNRGVALLMLDQRAAAQQDFEEALKAEPCLFDAHLNLKRLGLQTQVPSDCRFTEEQRNSLE
jgi:tetratricopeptide (TPR) repeat protein